MSDFLGELQLLIDRAAATGSDGSIELLLSQMDSDSATDLRLCAIPHRVNPEILLALDPELDEEQAQSRYKELSRLSVVIPFPDYFALHDDARKYLFAQWIGPPISSDFVAANARLVECLARRVTTDNGKSDEVLQGIRVFHLIGAEQRSGIVEFENLYTRKRGEFRLGECEKLIKLVREYDPVLSPQNAILCTYYEGELAADYHKWELAEKTLKRVLKSNEASPRLRAKAYNRLGLVRAAERNWYEAIENYQEALELTATLNEPGLTYRTLHDMGVAYRDSGDNWVEAKKRLRQSVRLAEKENDFAGMAMGYNSLGTLYRNIDRYRQAIRAYQKSIKYLSLAKDRFRPAQVYNNLGLVYMDRAKWRLSQKYFEQSLAIKRQAGDTIGQAKTLNNLARVYQNRKQYNQAIQSAEQAFTLFEEMRDRYNAALARRNLGKLYRRTKKRELATQALTEAIEVFEECNASSEAEATRRDLESITRRRGMPWWGVLLLQIPLIAIILLVMWLIILLAEITARQQLR